MKTSEKVKAVEGRHISTDDETNTFRILTTGNFHFENDGIYWSPPDSYLYRLYKKTKRSFMAYGLQVVNGFLFGVGLILAAAAMRVAFHLSLLN